MRRQEAKNNFQIKGRRYIFLKNVDHLTQEEKEALSRLEAQNLDTIQAMQIRMNLQQLFAMDAKTEQSVVTHAVDDRKQSKQRETFTCVQRKVWNDAC